MGEEAADQAGQAADELNAKISALEAKVNRLKANKELLWEDIGERTYSLNFDAAEAELGELREQRRRNKPFPAQVTIARKDAVKFEKRSATAREKLEHLQHQE